MLNQTVIKKARRHLRSADPVMKAVIDAVGPFTLRLERDRFGMLVRSIISQQISGSAARSIRSRLQEFVGTGSKLVLLAIPGSRLKDELGGERISDDGKR
jgi:DNA-3-methyladenine glycosylase II